VSPTGGTCASSLSPRIEQKNSRPVPLRFTRFPTLLQARSGFFPPDREERCRRRPGEGAVTCCAAARSCVRYEIGLSWLIDRSTMSAYGGLRTSVTLHRALRAVLVVVLVHDRRIHFPGQASLSYERRSRRGRSSGSCESHRRRTITLAARRYSLALATAPIGP